MALTNSQYDHFMRIYEKRQLDNENRLRGRYEEVYDRIPRLRELDQSISELSVRQARRMLDGDESALTALKEDLHLLFEEKKLLLTQAGYRADYLELSYTCPDCKDTGYIGKEKCHCFKKAIIDYMYTQSNLQEIFQYIFYGLLFGQPYRPADRQIFQRSDPDGGQGMSGIYAELCKGWRQSTALRRHWCGQDIFDALCGEGAFRSDIFRNILYSKPVN